jgi:hypothetical protein
VSEQRTDGWQVCLGSDRVAHVRAFLSRPQDFDALIASLKAIRPLLPKAATLDIDGDWAE